MSRSTVYLISAFGRSETLALSLKAEGFDIEIVDFTAAFPEEYLGGPGPFPVATSNDLLPAQRTLLESATPLEQGFSFWLSSGPLELSGPMSQTHATHHPEIKAWKTNASKGEFDRVWLARFLNQWASPYLEDSWANRRASSFPVLENLNLLPERREVNVYGFTEAQSRSVRVLEAKSLATVQTAGSRLTGIEIASEGSPVSISSEQWVWCLSGFETAMIATPEAMRSLFPKGPREPEWQWLCFIGSFSKGPWSYGLPKYTVLIGDLYLPWTYANVVAMRRVDDTQFRFWLKVPRARVGDIDARRGWAAQVEVLLQSRLPLADWKVEPAEWGLCPHSPVYLPSQSEDGLANFKNWDWISAETLPRLDLAARFEREGESFRRLTRWRMKDRTGGLRDRTLHAP